MPEGNSTAELFDSLAGRYDTAKRIEIAEIIATEIRARIPVGSARTALDYGCGTGLVGLALADLFESIVFVDASPAMIAQVRRKIETMSNADALCADLTAPAPPSLQADIVIVAQTLLHIKEVGTILSRLYDVLHKGGHLFVVDFDKNENVISDKVHNGFEQPRLIDKAHAAGFTHAKARTFYHGKQLFMGKDASLFILETQK